MSNADPPTEKPVSATEGEYVLSLDELLRTVWRRAWVVVLTAVLLTAAVVGYSFGQTPIYQASVTMLVGQKEQSEIPGGLGGDVQGLQQLTLTMAEAVTTRPIAAGVVERLDLDMSAEELLANTSAQQVSSTQFVQVDYQDPDPEQAKRVANTIGEVFSEQVSEVSPSANAITVTPWARAVTPDEPVSPNPLRNGLLALVAGLMIGVGLAFLLEYLDDSWRSPQEVGQFSGVPTFGAIPEFKMPKGKGRGAAARLDPWKARKEERSSEGKDLSGRLMTLTDPSSAVAEACRTLRTNLIYALVDNPPKVIVMTSPGPQEGKSTTCANLGVTLAQAGKRTLIVDCDLRRPVVHRVFGLRNIRGVVDVLVGQNTLQEVWQEPLAGLKVVSVGPIPPNPTELLGSQRFAGFLAEVREDFDYVLIDAPPIGLVSDPAILATQGDGVLLVLDAQKTRKSALREGLGSLEAVSAEVLGTVMNRVRKSSGSYYGYKYE